MSLIKPEWRSSNVVGMCMSIRETGDYSALPILADALQDADCDDEALLAVLRGERGSELASQRLVALIMSQETADAVAWMVDFAEHELGNHVDYDGGTQEMNYDVLMGAGISVPIQWRVRLRSLSDAVWWRQLAGRDVHSDGSVLGALSTDHREDR